MTSAAILASIMLMVIFGAGASFDSCSTYPPGAAISVTGESLEYARLNDYHRLPLAKDLFTNRPTFADAIDEFPQCKPVVSMLRDPEVTSGRVSVELRLREIEEQAQTYRPVKQELAAIRCYLAAKHQRNYKLSPFAPRNPTHTLG